MKFVRTQLIDKAPWWAILLLAAFYFISAFACIGVGGTGPGPLAGVQPALESGTSLGCSNPLDCTVSVKTSFTGLSGYNQAMWINAVVNRPTDVTRNAPALPNAAVSWEQEYVIDATGVNADGTEVALARNLTKTTTVRCEPNRLSCSGTALFRQAFIWYKDYHVTARFVNPQKVWIDQGLPASSLDLSAPVNITLRGGYISRDYTAFQISSKYTFFGWTIVMTILYVVSLVKGRGNRDPRDGSILPMSSDQIWVLVLAILLFWYNDPTVIVNVKAPTFVVSGFYAVCATTFIAVLMLYWLVTFDTARSVNGASGQAAAGPTARLATRCNCSAVAAGLVFWIPKLVWVSISWVLVLAFYAVSRAAWLSDPAFDIFAAYPYISQYFTSFLGAWGGIYVVYLAVLMAMGWYNCRLMTPAGRWVNLITLLSMLALLAGYFGNSILPVNASNSSIGFMVAYGVVNPYIWFLMVAHMPLYAHTKLEMAASEAIHASEVAAGKSVATSDAAPYGGVASVHVPKDTQTLLSLDASSGGSASTGIEALDVPITIEATDRVLVPRPGGMSSSSSSSSSSFSSSSFFTGTAGGGAAAGVVASAAATIPVPQEAVPDVDLSRPHALDDDADGEGEGTGTTRSASASASGSGHAVANPMRHDAAVGGAGSGSSSGGDDLFASPLDVEVAVPNTQAGGASTGALVEAEADGIQWGSDGVDAHIAVPSSSHQQAQAQQPLAGAQSPFVGDDGMIDPFAAEGPFAAPAHGQALQ